MISTITLAMQKLTSVVYAVKDTFFGAPTMRGFDATGVSTVNAANWSGMAFGDGRQHTSTTMRGCTQADGTGTRVFTTPAGLKLIALLDRVRIPAVGFGSAPLLVLRGSDVT